MTLWSGALHCNSMRARILHAFAFMTPKVLLVMGAGNGLITSGFWLERPTRRGRVAIVWGLFR